MTRPLSIALVQFKPRKGDYAANLARLRDIFAQVDALEPRPQLIVLPETALTGYFLEGGVREHALTAGTLAEDLNDAYSAVAKSGLPIDIVIGFYEVWQNTLHNSALYATLGAPDEDGEASAAVIQHVHRKQFLPTYGLFDEERFVERGFDVRAFDTPWGRAAMLVCEDAWHSLTGTIAALDGAQMVFVVSAAPARGAWPRGDGIPGPASVARWERLIRDIAEEQGVFVAYSNLVGSEGGKSFFGSSTVCGPSGDVRVRAPVWDEAIVSITIDLDDLTRARADSPLLSDLRTALPHLLGTIERIGAGVPAETTWDAAVRVGGEETGANVSAGARGAPPRPQHATARTTDHHPSVASSIPVVHVPLDAHGRPPALDIDAAMAESWLLEFLRDEFARRGFRDAVVGVSGGVDSAVVAYLAARALGPEHVVGVRLPYRASSPESLSHAQLVIDALGIKSHTIDITNAVDGYLCTEPDADAARRGNVMARTRMIALFDMSAKHHALPLGTGNKSERLLGYFTWHADDSPPVNPIGDLYKTQVWQLARHLGVPDVIANKPASADLVSGQTDEGDFGISYARADVILNWLLYGYTPADLVARGFDADEIALVRKRLEGTHWKRRLPAVAMMSSTAIGESYLRPVDY